MSNEGQAPSTGGYPPQGGSSQQTPPPGSYPPAGGAPQPGQYAPQPGQYAPQPGQYAPQPGQYAPQPGQYAQQPGQYPPGQYAPQPAAPRPNPFKGIPVADFVRDGLAALLLLVSLALPVTVGQGDLEGVGDRFHYVVTLVTLLSVVSLALPYLARASVFPPSWTVHTTRLVRLLANAPYVLVVLVYVVLDVVTSDEIQGVGTAFALGLAGAVLAAQPRQCELGPEDLDRGVSDLWLKITLGIGAFIALTYLVSLVLFLVDMDEISSLGSMVVVGHIVAWAIAVAFSLWMIYGTVFQKSPAWRLTLIGVATILVCAFVFGAGEDASLVKVESMRLTGIGFMFPLALVEGLGAIFIPAAAAAAAAPATVRALHREPREQTWIGTAVHGFDYAILVAGAAVVGAILWFTLDEEIAFMEKPTGALVTTIVLGLLAAGAALFARMQLRKDAAAGRVTALGAAGALFVLGLVILILVPSDTYGFDGKYVTPGHLLLAFGLPVMIAIALTAPKEVRAYFAANRPAPRATNSAAYQWSAPPAQQAGYQYPGQPQATAPYQGAPQPQAPYQAGAQNPQTGAWQTKALPVDPAAQPEVPAEAQASPQEQAPTPASATSEHGFTPAQASDPATPMAVLADIVQNAPELRPQVAANPTAYPALVEWLGQLGDPEIDAAIRSRTS